MSKAYHNETLEVCVKSFSDGHNSSETNNWNVLDVTETLTFMSMMLDESCHDIHNNKWYRRYKTLQWRSEQAINTTSLTAVLSPGSYKPTKLSQAEIIATQTGPLMMDT